jgi:dihydroorotate dehydrogenase
MGGLSGKPLTNRSTDVVRYLAKGLNGQVPIIASGGIFNAEDARVKLNAGATLIQVWTGFVYEGPSIVKNICSKL